MQFIHCSYNDFINRIKNKRIIQFGASTGWTYYESLFPDIYEKVVEKTDYIADNSSEKAGIAWDILGRKIPVKNPEALRDEQQPIILIAVRPAFQGKICEQLSGMDLSEEAECYSLQLMIDSDDEADNRCVEDYFKTHKEKKIPGKIHSFWFSGEEKPDQYKRCIESWYKFCPDYEIHEWNCDNYDVTKSEFMRQALEHKRWASISDYARVDVIHQYGGFYFDMDVEVIASIDKMRNADAFFCVQNDGLVDLGSGFGARRNHPFIKELLDFYEDKGILLPDGTIEIIPQPSLLMPLFYKRGMKRTHDSQIIKDTLILSNDYFTCIGGTADKWKWKGTEMGIHWHNAGWMSPEKRQVIEESYLIKQELIKNYFAGD